MGTSITTATPTVMGTSTPTVMGTRATAYLGNRPECPSTQVRWLSGAGSRAKTARDPAPLRYVGVPPTCQVGRTLTLDEGIPIETASPPHLAGRSWAARFMRLRRYSHISTKGFLPLTHICLRRLSGTVRCYHRAAAGASPAPCATVACGGPGPPRAKSGPAARASAADWLPSAPAPSYGPNMVNLGSVWGEPDEITVTTTDPDRITVWLGPAGATDLTREAAEELAGLLMRAVRELGG